MNNNLKKIETYKNFIFDLDGTLVDSMEDIEYCFKKAIFDETGIEIVEFRDPISGPPLSEVINKLLPDYPDSTKLNIRKKFRDIYDYYDYRATHLIEGSSELLKKLKSSGKRVYLATNKPLIPTMKILNKLEINIFDDIATIDSNDSANMSKSEMIALLISKCKLEKTETIMIGDYSTDIIAAKNNSVDAVALTNGNFLLQDAVAIGSEYIFNKISDILLYI